MSSQNPLHATEHSTPDWHTLYKISAISALLQLVTVVVYFIIIATLGARPASVEGYFAILQNNPLEGFLRGDLMNLLIVALYLGLVPGLYMALRRLNPIGSVFSGLLILIAVTLCFASNSDFSMLHLSSQYAQAVSEARRTQIMAAGEAMIAADMWNGTGAYIGGMFLQGAGVLISVMMLRNENFSKATALAGILGNLIDLLQHLLHPFFPATSEIILRVAGPFYLIWFPMLVHDFLRLARTTNLLKTKIGREHKWQPESW